MRIPTSVVTILMALACLPWAVRPAHAQKQIAKSKETNTMEIKRITPVLFVQDVEPCVKFWVERMGFQKTAEVPGDDGKPAFAMLQKGSVELMYQSYASADKDVASIAEAVRKGPSFLYIEVESLDDAIAASKGSDVVIPVRTTFYGSKEIGIKDPAGHFITFAEFAHAEKK